MPALLLEVMERPQQRGAHHLPSSGSGERSNCAAWPCHCAVLVVGRARKMDDQGVRQGGTRLGGLECNAHMRAGCRTDAHPAQRPQLTGQPLGAQRGQHGVTHDRRLDRVLANEDDSCLLRLRKARVVGVRQGPRLAHKKHVHRPHERPAPDREGISGTSDGRDDRHSRF